MFTDRVTILTRVLFTRHKIDPFLRTYLVSSTFRRSDSTKRERLGDRVFKEELVETWKIFIDNNANTLIYY